MKGQVVADFIVDHAVDVDYSDNFVQLKAWGLYFDGSVCSRGQGAGCAVVSPTGVYIDLSIRLEFACTNNQVEYESLMHGLEFLRDLGARDADMFGDSNLIMQQIRGDSQCLDRVLNSYQDKCLDIIKLFDTFSIKHIPREENSRANRLAQQALGYVVIQGVFWVESVSLVEHKYALRSKGKSILEDSDQLRDKEKPIPGNAKRLPGNTDRLSGKIEPESGRIESEPGEIELGSCKEKPVLGNTNKLPGKVDWLSRKADLGEKLGSDKAEPGPSYGCGLREELEPILDKEDNEELVTKKSKSGKDRSPIDEEKMEPMKEDDSVKGGVTIRTDWRLPLLKCIREPGKTTYKKVKRQVLKYTSLHDDLYRKTINVVLLKCLGEEQANVAVREVHDGICGVHQSAYKIDWLLWRSGFYWLTMMDDCVKYHKGCEACQMFRNIQLAPAGVMNSIVKPWLFRGWGLDFVGKIHPGSSKGHRFILVAMDYFTKWTKAVPLRIMTHREVMNFVQQHIIYRFGIPQTLITDQGPLFMSHQFREFAESMKIKLLNSSPYYAQANCQAKASNKVLIKIIKKRIKDNPKRWHEKLSEALWAHRTSRHRATKVTPFELVYGQEAVLPVEVSLEKFDYY
jgi:ribonuclease HI